MTIILNRRKKNNNNGSSDLTEGGGSEEVSIHVRNLPPRSERESEVQHLQPEKQASREKSTTNISQQGSFSKNHSLLLDRNDIYSLLKNSQQTTLIIAQILPKVDMKQVDKSNFHRKKIP